jgi:hypothetical protein
MMNWTYSLSNHMLALLILGGTLAISIGGLLLLRRPIYNFFRISRATDESVNGFFSGVGVLAGLLLGLVAVAAWQNYDEVGRLVSREAACVSTLYRDVSTLNEPAKHELQQDLKDYLHYIVEISWPAQFKGEVRLGATEIVTVFMGRLAQYHAATDEQKLFISKALDSFNQLAEVRRMRLDAVEDGGLPDVFWCVILAGSLITIVMTYFYHLPTMMSHIVLTGLYALSLGLMIFLVASLDNPFRGDVSVTAQPYVNVLNSLELYDPEKLKGKHFH